MLNMQVIAFQSKVFVWNIITEERDIITEPGTVKLTKSYVHPCTYMKSDLPFLGVQVWIAKRTNLLHGDSKDSD